ncbi:MAG: 50S ribosomal protein L11 methyltransferase [Desulfurococcales archaeon]|nr:50S ribosomal protein L11 methyltransferase [Desulfurococcales archaeon]
MQECGETRAIRLNVGPVGEIVLSINDCVYEPSDDSFLVAEALGKLRAEGRKYESIVDIGTGSGVLALVAYLLFKPRRLVAVDISPCSVLSARINLAGEVIVSRCYGASCLSGSWDLAVVNPPYLPLPAIKEPYTCREMLEASWSGLGVYEKLLHEASRLAREVLAIHSSLYPTSPEAVLVSRGFEYRILASAVFFMEKLVVIHAYKGY